MQQRTTIPTPNHLVTLHEFVPDDAGTLFRLIEDNRDYLSRHHMLKADDCRDESSVRSGLRRTEGHPCMRLGIWVHGELVGYISADIDIASNAAAIGYWLAPEYTGFKYGSAALRGFIAHAFTNMNCHSVCAEVRRDNAQSLTLLDRLSFKQVSGEHDSVLLALNYACWHRA